MRLVWVTVIRGVMAIVLGVGLALHHDRAPEALGNFMGVYWLLNGVVTFRFALTVTDRRRRIALVAGTVGIATGAVVLLANVDTTILLAILGVVMTLTGIVHVLGGFELAVASRRRWRPGVPLGVLEMGLGATLFLALDLTGGIATWLASAWAVLGGVVLVTEAIAIRRRLLAAAEAGAEVEALPHLPEPQR